MKTALVAVLLSVCASNSFGAAGYGEKSGLLGLLIELRSARESIEYGLRAAGLSTCVPFCLETTSKDGPLLRAEVDYPTHANLIPVSAFIAIVEKRGFTVKVKEDVVLVTSPAVAEVATNPLDTQLHGFVFSGTHSAFVKELRSRFPPGTRPFEIRLGAPNNSPNYVTDIHGNVSIRDVLSLVAADYGVSWTVNVFFEFRKPPGDVTNSATPEFKLSNVMWEFGSVQSIPRCGPFVPQQLDVYIQATRKTDSFERRAAIGMLVQSTDPEVIGPLVDVCGREPEIGYIIVGALSGFFDRENARSGILSLATTGNVNALHAAILAFDEHRVPLPNDFCQKIIETKSLGKTYLILKYLVSNGNADQLPFVKPLVRNGDKDVRELASQFITRVEGAAR